MFIYNRRSNVYPTVLVNHEHNVCTENCRRVSGHNGGIMGMMDGGGLKLEFKRKIFENS